MLRRGRARRIGSQISQGPKGSLEQLLTAREVLHDDALRDKEHQLVLPHQPGSGTRVADDVSHTLTGHRGVHHEIVLVVRRSALVALLAGPDDGPSVG